MLNDLNSPKEKIDFSIAIATILIAGVFICFYAFQSERNQFEIAVDNSEVDHLIIEEEKYVIDKSINETTETYSRKRNIDRPTEEIYTPIDTTVEVSEVEKNISYGAVNEIVIEKPEPEIAPRTETKIIEAEKSNALLEKNAFGSTPKETIKKAPKTKEAPPIASTIKSENSQKKCIILIGAFRNNSNKKKLLKQLESDGFKTFQTPFKDLERIGIYEVCDLDKLTNTLLDIRERYAADAIILKKQ